MRLQKNRILLNIYWASIYKDVADKAYRSARLAKLGVQDETAGEVLESEVSLSANDSSLLRRAMTGALAEVQTLVIRQHSIWEQSHVGNNRNIAEENVKITMIVPRNFDLAAVQPMAELIHDYIVQKAMYVWFSYTVPARAEEQLKLSQITAQNILQLLRARVRMLHHGTEVEVNIGDTSTETSDVTLNKTKVTLLEAGEEATVTATTTGVTGDLTWTLTPTTSALALTVSSDGMSCEVKLASIMASQETAILTATAKNGFKATCEVVYGEPDD